MSNVIEGNFGVNKIDQDLLAGIYTNADVDCVGYVVEQQFSNLSRFSLMQEKAIRFAYVKMQEQVTTLATNYYENGQRDKDLKMLEEFRKSYQDFELMIVNTMRVGA